MHPFRSTEQLEVFLCTVDGSPSQVYPPPPPPTPCTKYVGTHLYTWVERGTVRVKQSNDSTRAEYCRGWLEPGVLDPRSTAMTLCYLIV